MNPGIEYKLVRSNSEIEKISFCCAGDRRGNLSELYVSGHKGRALFGPLTGLSKMKGKYKKSGTTWKTAENIENWQENVAKWKENTKKTVETDEQPKKTMKTDKKT